MRGLSDDQLDGLYQVATDLGDVQRSMDDIYDDHRAFHLDLLAPAVSPWDERILTVLWQACERYVRIGFGLLDTDPDEHLAHNETIARKALAEREARLGG